MKKMTGLGRGLDALIDTSHVDTNGGSSISEIELTKIIANPDQPRRTFDEEALQELADSIREHGVISPITLRDNGDDTYMIIAGERRFRASKMAGCVYPYRQRRAGHGVGSHREYPTRRLGCH